MDNIVYREACMNKKLILISGSPCVGKTAVGVLAGSQLATLMKPAKRWTRLIFITTGLVFSGNIIQSRG